MYISTHCALVYRELPPRAKHAIGHLFVQVSPKGIKRVVRSRFPFCVFYCCWHGARWSLCFGTKSVRTRIIPGLVNIFNVHKSRELNRAVELHKWWLLLLGVHHDQLPFRRGDQRSAKYPHCQHVCSVRQNSSCGQDGSYENMEHQQWSSVLRVIWASFYRILNPCGF